MLRLRYSAASPFVRKVLVAAHELDLVAGIELVATDVWDPDTDIQRDNPLGKIPALVTEHGVLASSALCCEYLDAREGGHRLIPVAGATRWRALALQAYGDGVMDAAVARFTEERRRPLERIFDGNVIRQTGKITGTLAMLEDGAFLPEAALSIGSIAIACALGYLDFRLPGIAWRDGRPKLAHWFAQFEQRPSMQATRPHA